MTTDAIPRSGEYSDGELWFDRRGTLLTLGITLRGIEAIGTIEAIELPEIDEVFKKGDVIATIDGTQGQVELVAPARGTVTEINKASSRDVDRVMEDPVEEGWLVRFDLVNVDDLKELP